MLLFLGVAGLVLVLVLDHHVGWVGIGGSRPCSGTGGA